ncbi:hypothetical protein [Halolamina sp. C58]|uniref:hypothetical protein n=1 Tax=Halolamina sp. C58 TaxID=3421640 RepID=UPI003EC02C1D
MGLFSTDCAYCGDSGASENCSQCGMDFHAECAQQRGDLQIKEEGGGLLSSSTTHYRWACPNCGRRSNGSF